MHPRHFLPISIFIIVFIASFSLRLLPVLNYNFPFTMDQGRDMLDIRNIAVGKHFSLIGPTTSINGVFLGPFWYYFNVAPFILGGGDPSALVYWQVAWYALAGLLIFIILRNRNLPFSLIFSILFMLSPALFYSSRYSWSANPMPIFTVMFFLLLIKVLEKTDLIWFGLLGLVCGLSMQIEAAFGILFFPFATIVLLFKRTPAKSLSILCLGFFITLLPQAFFEIRHNFVMTHTFIAELTGKSAILGNKLTLEQTFLNHLPSFINKTNKLVELPNEAVVILIILSVVFLAFCSIKGFITKGLKEYFFIFSSFVLFAFIFYMFYHYPLKDWYLLGLTIPFIAIIACFLTEILRYLKPITHALIIILFFFILLSSVNTQAKFILGPNERSTDRSNLRNELEDIDWVYQKAEGKGFKVFSYLPSVYDFPYQYLFWWYGTKKYDYQPFAIAYLENVPEYIPNNLFYLQKRRPLQTDYLTFLITEKDHEIPDRQYAWRGNFTNLCQQEHTIFSWETEIEIMVSCKKKF